MAGLALSAAAALAALGAGGAAEGLERVDLLRPELAFSELALAELDGRPGLELVLIGVDGEVEVRSRGGESAFPLVVGEPLRLGDPARTLLDFAPIVPAASEGAPREQLVQVGPRGALLFRYADGAFGAPEPLARRARFDLRVGRPRLADVARDVNGDGRQDLVVPGPAGASLWLGGSDAEGRPTLTRAAEVALAVQHEVARETEELSDVWRAGFTIPELSLRDMNGDGRADLVVVTEARRAFHLQRPDGTLPAEPDVVLRLELFRDTSPAAEMAPGRTLAAGDQTHYESRDLDGDGIPDHVLAHRRKVWVFRGTSEGPQFREPSAILKAADDVTAIVLARLDDDARPDLLVFKVEIPSVAALIRGLFSEWEVAIAALGYRNRGEGAFETQPAWKGEVRVRLPAILSLVKDAESLLERFRDVGREFRPLELADLDGDGREDVLLVGASSASLDVWLARSGDPELDPESADRLLRQVFFEEQDEVWDLERILGFVTSLARRRVERLTSGREPDARLELPPHDRQRLAGLWTADLDGDGREEVLLRYVDADGAGGYALDLRRLGGR